METPNPASKSPSREVTVNVPRIHHECMALRVRGYTGGGSPNPPTDALPLVIVALPAVCASGDHAQKHSAVDIPSTTFAVE
ncbi:hypothetical protein E2C01_040507 [Portunus trituberculatus]|uniref:Uncharacterized protein n=1 Tax=Portunus trituberculatus TaxID=210409 RepID=A0A5B7FGV5_PORTR|nr:hypothetical protein [Portunus trituberculatus]